MSLKAHAFSVRPTDSRAMRFEKILERHRANNFTNRLRTLSSGTPIRLDEIDNNGYDWYMDFVYFRRRAGPGRVSMSDKVSGFKFKKGECFGEETAAYYNEKTRILVIQYNHHGPKADAISEFFTETLNEVVNSYTLYPQLDKASQKKLESMTLCKSIQVSFASENLPPMDSPHGKSVAGAVEMMRRNGGTTLDIKIGKTAGLALSSAIETVTKVVGLSSFGVRVKKAKIRGIITDEDDVEGPTETIDLIAQRLERIFDLDPGADLRLEYDARKALLKYAYDEWMEDKEFTGAN